MQQRLQYTIGRYRRQADDPLSRRVGSCSNVPVHRVATKPSVAALASLYVLLTIILMIA
eukprot:COSAG06_NODE_98_length_24155_cov_29.681784_13_plen_59_part_00